MQFKTFFCSFQSTLKKNLRGDEKIMIIIIVKKRKKGTVEMQIREILVTMQ